MRVEVGDRVVVHGRNGTHIGVVLEGTEDGGSRVQWADGGDSVLSVGSDAPESAGHTTWNAAKAGAAVTWHRGVTAGVGREAAIAQEKLAAEVVAEEAVVDEEPAGEHKPASGE